MPTTDPSSEVDRLSATALSQLTGTTVLNCLGKQPGPPTLAADLAHIIDLPDAVRDDLWSVLEPHLGAINTPHTSQAVAAYCDRHQLEPRAITPVIGACRFLFLRGAEHNTPPALIGEDIKQLLADEKGDDELIDAVLAIVIPCYEQAAPKLRIKAIYEALTDHGKVVTDVKWRVDNVSHANTGEAINVPVALLTLKFREGDQSGQATVQLLPDELKKLHQACEQALR
ncbi:MAG: hypothetical protein JRI55_22085 [Deltaproteobacteria bacterium]|jgi:hypothetical protein|nr:hypothetical protein [Deltaproteobacteria bacterium]